MKKDYPKIISVIVTYNRSKLLRRCIEAVLKQSFGVSKLIVVDNASTDNTNEVVRNFNDSRIEYIRLDSNKGGAGGFHEGVKRAYAYNDCDAVWVMDDDGIPAEECLRNLVVHLDGHDFISPLVLDIDSKTDLSFPYIAEKTKEEVETKYGSDGIIQNYSCPFNGLLLSNNLLKVCGFPKEDMFIWGDEVEYQYRAIHYGFKPCSIINAKFYHPKDRMVFKKDILGKHTIIDVDSDLRRYCKYRNYAYTLKKYCSISKNVVFIVKYSLYFILQKKSLKGLEFWIRAVYDGYTNNFKNHRKYLY